MNNNIPHHQTEGDLQHPNQNPTVMESFSNQVRDARAQAPMEDPQQESTQTPGDSGDWAAEQQHALALLHFNSLPLHQGNSYNASQHLPDHRTREQGLEKQDHTSVAETVTAAATLPLNRPTQNRLMGEDGSQSSYILRDSRKEVPMDHGTGTEVYNAVAEALEQHIRQHEHLPHQGIEAPTVDVESYLHHNHASWHARNQGDFETGTDHPPVSLKRPLEEATNLEICAADLPQDTYHTTNVLEDAKRQRLHIETPSLGLNGDLTGDAVRFDFESNDLFYGGRRNSTSPTNSASSAGAKRINNEQWDIMYERLKFFKQEQGHCLVPKRYAKDPKLGTWVETQRVQFKRLTRTLDPLTGMEMGVQPNNRLTAERLQKLDAIGFAWSAKHVRKNTTISATGNLSNNNAALIDGPRYNISTSQAFSKTAVEGDMGISAIDSAMRTTLLPNAQELQPQQRRQRLNDAQWEDMYQRLVQFKMEHGHCLVPRKYEKDQKLGTWVETQRVLWNRDYRKVGPKEAVQAAAATAMATSMTMAGYDGSDSKVASSMFEAVPPTTTEMAGSTEQYTHVAMLPGSFDATKFYVQSENGEGGAAPTNSVQTKVAADKGKRLTLERKQKLDELGFIWSLRSKRIEDHWDEMFKQLQAYREEHGDCLVPSRYEANLKLGKWVETQRYEYTKLQRSNGLASTSTGTASDNDLGDTLSVGAVSENAAKGSRQINPRLTEERLRRLESIGFQWKVKHKMKRYYDKQWDSMFDRLKAFKEANGHCIVPKRYPADIKLGTWVHTQRIQYRKLMAGTKKEALTEEEVNVMKSCGDEVSYRLTEERRARLESIGFVWNMREGEKGTETGRITRNSYDDQWDVMFDTLREYKRTCGNCLVPKRYKDNPKLGTWVDTQRVQYKKLQKKLAEQGKPHDARVALEVEDVVASKPDDCAAALEGNASKPLVGRLTEERIRRLQELGFVWSLRDDWQKHYEELKKFKEIHGHCNVPARYAENRRLGIWVSAQRQQFKTMHQMSSLASRRAAPLTQDRIELLNKLGFTWTIRSRDSLGESWNQRLEELKRFKERHGHCMVPSRYAESPELGIWVGTQRTQYRLYMKAKETGESVSGAAAMNESRIRILEELGFVWALRGNREEHMNLRQVHTMQQPLAGGGSRDSDVSPALDPSTAMYNNSAVSSHPV